MIITRYFMVLAAAAILSGCSMADITGTMKGRYYMETGNYEVAEETFRQMVKQDPDNATNQYYLGRFLLAQGDSSDSIPHLKKAVAIDRSDTDYNFWLGVAYGESNELKAERIQYERTLKLSSGYTKAQLYLGHSQLRSGELTKALKMYDKVLKSLPTNAAALYNRALILDMQKKKKDAREGWLEYLKWYPAGGHAIQAVENLNALGDFSYENHFFGIRTVTLKQIKFEKRSNKVSIESLASLRLAGKIVSNLEKGNLQIVVFESDLKKSPQKRAFEIRKRLLEISPDLPPERVWVSWIKEPEVTTINGQKHIKHSSVRLFLSEWK